jgi:hypothetical protein
MPEEDFQIQDEPAPVPVPVGFVLLAPGTIASDFSLQSLSKALGEAQNEFDDAVKSAVNTYGGWKYTPLKAIVDAVRPSITKYHLTILQFPVTNLEEKTITIYTRLSHWDSGEWMQNALEVPGELALGKDGAPKFNQQTIGGSQTYAQKYAYKAIAGIPDGEEMIDSTDEKGDLPSRKKSQQPATRPTTTAQPAQQQTTQRAATAPAAAQPQGAVLKFIPPNGLTAVIKGVKEIKGLPAKPADGDIPAVTGVRARLIVTLLGQHNGVSEASCFDTKLWPAIKESVGLECHFQIFEGTTASNKPFIRIEDLIYVAGEEYVNGQPVPPPDQQ